VLYFSKLKIFVIYFIIVLLSFFSLTNFIGSENNIFVKKVNLGLDLQGGSYLLLEVDSNPIIKQKLQNKLITLRKTLKENNFKYKNLNLKDKNIIFHINKNEIIKFEKFFLNKSNPINSFYERYNSYELDYSITEDVISINFSKFGLIEIASSSLEQSLEIVRKRIDEVGTNDPTIIKRGNNRILVELPGLDDPNRIKKLLGKTANLSFRLVSDDSNFGSELLSFDKGDQKLNISKRVLLSGDNLINARPSLDNRSNETIVSFTLDRVGAKKFAKITTANVGKKLAIF